MMKMMSRRSFLKAAAGSIAAMGLLNACGGNGSSTPSGSEEAPGKKDFTGAELVVATWGWAEAGLRKLAAGFEEQYGCTIVVDPTAGNAPRLNKLMAEKDDPQADIALLSKSFADKGAADGLFEKIDTSVVTSLGELYDIAQNKEGYGPCYSMCRYGIMYDKKALEEKNLEAPKSYQDLFDDKYAHLVALPAMNSTACPYMLVAMEEAMGGTQEDVSDAFKLMQDKKDNLDVWYSTTADVTTAFSTGECCIALFMDINMPGLIGSGFDMVWVDPAEGTIGAPAAINVVKNAKNAELAQLFVQYVICKETQDKIAECMNEAPCNKNAATPEDQKAYLADSEEEIGMIKAFDDAFINNALDGWIETFNKTVAVQ